MRNIHRFKIVAVFSILIFLMTRSISFASPPGPRVEVSSRRGFDTCAGPNYAQMVQIGNNSDFWSYVAYIGGLNASCPLNDPSFINGTAGYGWGFLPVYVGRQAPCSGFANKVSTDVATAQAQANSDATDAENRATFLGFTVGSLIYLDVEAYSNSVAGCHTAMKAYIAQWILKLHNDGWKTGAYGSACVSYVSDWALFGPPPDQVFIREVYAPPVSTANTNVLNRSCVNNLVWSVNQRHHQYLFTTAAKTYGTYTLPNRDETCSQGWVAATGYNDGVLNTCP